MEELFTALSLRLGKPRELLWKTSGGKKAMITTEAEHVEYAQSFLEVCTMMGFQPANQKAAQELHDKWRGWCDRQHS